MLLSEPGARFHGSGNSVFDVFRGNGWLVAFQLFISLTVGPNDVVRLRRDARSLALVLQRLLSGITFENSEG